MSPELGLTIGRDGDLVIDANPHLHRRFLRVSFVAPSWRLRNQGSALVATVTDRSGGLVAGLGPGAGMVLPQSSIVRFVAGPTRYELEIDVDECDARDPPQGDPAGLSTLVGVQLSPAQHRLLLALAERSLRSPGASTNGVVPTYLELANRLADRDPASDRHRWTEKSCERMLGEVFRKLERSRVRLAGEQKRAALVDYAIKTGIVRADELGLLDQPEQDELPPAAADVEAQGDG